MGQSETALAHWRQALHELGLDDASLPSSTSDDLRSLSPSKQRLAVSALLSLSGHFASARDFKSATELEKIAIPLILHSVTLTSAPSAPPIGLQAETPDGLIHSLSLLYRASVLLMHLAEVNFALSSSPDPIPSPSSSKWSRLWSWTSQSPLARDQAGIDGSLHTLRAASDSAEQICLALSDSSLPSLDSITSTISQGLHTSSSTSASPIEPSPPSSTTPTVDEAYITSPILAKPAKSLLRQSKRLAAQSLLLRGILLEKKGESHLAEALEVYERALAWSGGGPDGRAGQDSIETEWKGIWSRYVKVREKVMERNKDHWKESATA